MSAWYVYTMRAATIRQSVGVCRVLYMYRRGLTALLILADGQCESLTSEISKNSSPRIFCYIGWNKRRFLNILNQPDLGESR
mgnify:CR=1 FL=1